MRALKVTQQLSIDELTVSEVEEPQPEPGEIRVRLRAAALNHRDLHFFDTPVEQPVILGSDGSGIVDAVGSGVAGWSPGAEVVINPSLDWGDRDDVYAEPFTILGDPCDGTFAEAICVTAAHVFPRPAHLPWEEAAALPLAGLTAYRALFARAQVKAGETVLIHGIGGGVALFALQFARAAGARIMVTSTSDEKLERASALGADLAVNSRTADWVDAARTWSRGGVDAVVESIGGEYFTRSLDALRQGGRLVSFGRSMRTETAVNIGTLFWQQLTILGSMMGSPRDFAAMLDFVAAHRIVPIIDSTYPLAEGREAFRRMKAGQQFGKIVLAIS
jgi:NADPH:quinone reductase-like Zn-dependent oxidoreductase